MEAYLLYTVAALQWGYAVFSYLAGNPFKGILMFLYGVTNIIIAIMPEGAK